MGTLGKTWATPPEERFWVLVNKDGPVTSTELGPCWEWIGCIRRGGYGSFHWSRYKVVGAHQASWMLSHGEIPHGKCVLHKCDNRRCVRESHLWLGTKTENNRDRDAKGKHVPLRGEAQGQAKLTDAKVREIRTRYANGETGPQLANIFNVDRTLIWQVATRRIWKHVP